MFPYWTPAPLRAGALWLFPDRLLIAAGILVGYALLLRRARSRGLQSEAASHMALAMVLGGLVIAHLYKLLYLETPGPFSPFAIFDGSASFGGLLGGLLCGWIYLRQRSVRPLPYFDALAFVFPIAWMLGRIGCYLVHDHPGIRTDSWLGVAYPGGARFDLGLLEALFMPLLLAAFWILDRRPRPRGFYLSTFLVIYGVFRLWLDTLHVDPVRYFGITVDQWSAALAIAIGMAIARSRSKISEAVSCKAKFSAA